VEYLQDLLLSKLKRTTIFSTCLVKTLIWSIVGNCVLTISTFMFYVNIIVGSFSTVFENVGFVKFS